MSAKHPSLSRLLSKPDFPDDSEKSSIKKIKQLQLKLLHVQQGVFHSGRRAIIVFEGFDAAGKGGTIRRLTERLDPRGVRVHAIGPPSRREQAKHYLYRFWRLLPDPGMIVIFDRSWYGRLLVERVEKLADKDRWKAAYKEINQFESMLSADGIDIVKVFLAIHPDEQLKRFEERLRHPYKFWKLNASDIEAHKKWDKYVSAADDIFRLTHSKIAPWHLISADSKSYAHAKTFEVCVQALAHHSVWMDEQIEEQKETKKLKNALKALRQTSRS